MSAAEIDLVARPSASAGDDERPDALRSADAEAERTLTIAEISTPTERVRVLTMVDPEGGELPAWAPGAHIDLRLGELVRQYSLLGDPRDPTRWQVAVLLERESRGGSSHVHERLAVGDAIVARGPRNHFRFDQAARYRFVAGGIGITPLLQMVRAAHEQGAEWTLDYGGRSRADMVFADELLAQYGDRIRLHPREASSLRGQLSGILADVGTDELVYCCGPAALLDAVETASSAWPEGALRIERFTPREIEIEDEDESFEVELAQSGTVVTIPADLPIMTALRDAGFDVPSSCEEGTCGTCETAVLGGEIDHRDSLLTASERAANDVLFICVSRAARGCPRLVLDR